MMHRLACRSIACCAAAIWLALAPGCAATPDHETAQQQAQSRWERMRAKVKLQLAERNFETAQIDESHKLTEEVLALDPTNLDAYLLMCRVQLEKGRNAEAEAALDSAAGLGQAVAELDYLRGVLAERREQTEDAARWYERAYVSDPTEPAYLLAFAESLLVLDQLETAANLLADRRQDFEQDVRVQVLLGQVLAMLGRHRDASDAYMTVMRLAPDDVRLREEAGLALIAADRTDEAQIVLEPLLKSKDPPPSVTLIRAVAGALLDAGKQQAAMSLLERGVADHAAEASLWLLLGKARLMADEPAAARGDIERACRIAPDLVEARLLLAYAALTAGDREAAADAARQIIAVSPDDPQARALLAAAIEN